MQEEMVYNLCWQAKHSLNIPPSFVSMVIVEFQCGGGGKSPGTRCTEWGQYTSACVHANRKMWELVMRELTKKFCTEIQNGISFIVPLARFWLCFVAWQGLSQATSNTLLIRLPACLEQAQQSEWLDNFNRGRQDLFQMCFTAYGGQVASHHGDNQVARLGQAKFGRMILKQIYWNEWFMLPATSSSD